MRLTKRSLWTLASLIAVALCVSAAKHVRISSKTHRLASVRGTKKSLGTSLLMETDKKEPIMVSQFTGLGSRQTQTPIDTDGSVRDVEPLPDLLQLGGETKDRYVSSYMKGVPKDDDTTEEFVDVVSSLAKAKEFPVEQASKKDGQSNVNGQLLAVVNTADTAQQQQEIAQQQQETAQQQQETVNAPTEYEIAIKEGMLAHNSFRLLHHVQPLQWNESLAGHAQRIARAIANDPSTFQGESPGENVAQIWHDFPHAPLKASNIWYSERKDYSFAYPKYSDNVRHYSQMIWKGTTQVGLGVAASPSDKYRIVVALYWPIGNNPHPKELAKNIPKPGGGLDVYATLKWKISRPNESGT